MPSYSVITSLNQKYYDDVGFRMIESFLKFWPENINLYIYSEEKIDIEIQSERIKIVNLFEVQPSLKSFIDRANKRPDAKLLKSSLKKGAVRFSYKSFAIIDGGLNLSEDYIIWHDADMVTHKQVSASFLESLVNEDKYSVYLGRKNTYTETGFLIFNTKLPVNKVFMNSWRDIYEKDEIYNLDEWHDCKCFDKLRSQLNTSDYNLSPWGKDYDHVFINSILGEYFDHLKGERKSEGSSNATDIFNARPEKYWQKIQDSLITIVCVSDESYLKYLKTLIVSSLRFSKNISFEVLLININNRDLVTQELQKLSEFISITFKDQNFENDFDKQSFCANSRVGFIKSLLEKGINKILYLDADSLVRKDLQKYDWDFQESDIEILFRESENEEKFKFATGVIAVKNSPGSINFFQSWDALIQPYIYEWFADQVTFYRNYNDFKQKLIFKKLSPSMIDWQFNPESTIWVGKGSRKYRNILYRLESLKSSVSSMHIIKLINIIQRVLNKPNQLYLRLTED